MNTSETSLAEVAVAIFGDGGSEVESIFRTEKVLCMSTTNTALGQHACTTLKSNGIKVKWEKGIYKRNIDGKNFEPNKTRLGSTGEKPSMSSLADRHSNGSTGQRI